MTVERVLLWPFITQIRISSVLLLLSTVINIEV